MGLLSQPLREEETHVNISIYRRCPKCKQDTFICDREADGNDCQKAPFEVECEHCKEAFLAKVISETIFHVEVGEVEWRPSCTLTGGFTERK